MGRLLGSLSVGDRVKLNERGVPQKYIFLEKDHYGIGTGSILIREFVFSTHIFSYQCSYYEGSYIDVLCDIIYPQLFDLDLQKALKAVPILIAIKVASGYYNFSDFTTVYRRGFLLSITELGYTKENYNVEGNAFSYFDSPEKCRALIKEDPSQTRGLTHWTRSYNAAGNKIGNFYYDTRTNNGIGESTPGTSSVQYVRPVFALNSDITVSSSTDSDGCYTIESIPAAGSGSVYVKNNGVWVQS